MAKICKEILQKRTSLFFFSLTRKRLGKQFNMRNYASDVI